MASIAKRTDGQWRARYRDAAGKEHSRHFARKVDAQRWLDEVTASVVAGTYVDPKAARTTLAAYAATWQVSQIGSEATARLVDNALRLHILPALGAMQLGAILPDHVQGLIKKLSLTLAPGSVRNVYDVLYRVMASAVRSRKIPRTPCDGIKLPPMGDADVEAPTPAQVVALVDAIDPRYRGAVVLLAGSGLRIGELLGLRIADVNFLGREVRVERQRLQSGQIAPTKTTKSVRVVPLGDVVLEALAAHLAAYPSPEWLFTTPAGDPLLYRAWKIRWARATKAAGVDLGTHSLRHFYASALIAGGASVKQVQAVLGHSSAVITLRTYAHLWPGDDDRTRAVIDGALDLLRTPCGLGDLGSGIAAGQGA